MNYKIYRLNFITGVHFGKSTLTNSDFVFYADTLFSALCKEVLKLGDEAELERLFYNIRQGKLQISDGLPYYKDIYYVPKPMLVTQRKKDSSIEYQKRLTNLRFLPMDMLENYLLGTLSEQELDVMIDKFGTYYMQTRANVSHNEETIPYGVSAFKFKKDCGLYIIVGYETEKEELYFREIMKSLSYTGIGGKISSGLGKFVLEIEEAPRQLIKRLQGEYKWYMSLSISLPQDNELEKSMEGATYHLIKRSGFVASEYYAKEQRKKRDLYCFLSGSCFVMKYKGDMIDVSNGGGHPVYRYMIPMWIGV